MSVRDLIPWSRNNRAPNICGSDMDLFLSLHRNINRLFEDALRGFDTPPLFGSVGGTWPSVEFSENETEMRVNADVPGLDQKDIEVLLDGDVLTIRGAKKSRRPRTRTANSASATTAVSNVASLLVAKSSRTRSPRASRTACSP
jgi:HSP20 family molecular chaperone IbpA